MAELYKNFKKSLLDGNIDLENDTIKISLTTRADGFVVVGGTSIFERLWQKWNKPVDFIKYDMPESIKCDGMVIYKEPHSELKYFDIECPLIKEKGRWVRWQPIVSYMDLRSG